ncbi:MAG: hypothetical protein H6828_02375 [Planctomycetes bacterium]|nr:hypothetical protein [Planctomycetota bacterium]
MKLVVPLVLGLALAAGLLPPTTAMQGTYRGPGDHVPWNHARASSGSTPAPQEPAAPPDEPRRRPADLDAPAVEAAAPDLPTPPGPVDPTRWSWWWAFNRDGYLDLRRHVLDARTLLGTDDFLLGAGQVRPARSLAPDEEVRRRVIGPALRQALEQGPAAVRAEALLALAKLHPAYAPSDVPLAEQLASHLAAGNRREAEAAVVALGWLAPPTGWSCCWPSRATTRPAARWSNAPTCSRARARWPCWP